MKLTPGLLRWFGKPWRWSPGIWQRRETHMLHLIRLTNALRKDSRGVTALEYGLIAGGISMVIIGSVTSLGTTIAGVFSNLAAGAW